MSASEAPAAPPTDDEGHAIAYPPFETAPRTLAAHVGRGFLMGGADIIPGVSGGTVALILGIYTRLITAVGSVDQTLLGHVADRQFAAAAKRLDLSFVIPLGVGVLLGAATLGSIVDVLLNDYRQFTLGLFFGLIAASAVYVAKLVPQWDGRSLAAVVLGATAAFFLVAIPALANPPESLWYLFLCGTIGICAMILPGVSGAFLLLLLGVYLRVTSLIKRTVKLEMTGEDLLALAVFAAGCLVGLLSFARLLSRLLKWYPSATLAALCGLMIGSLRKLWPFQNAVPGVDDEHPLFVNRGLTDVPIDGDFWITCGLAVLGVGIVLVMDWLGGDESTEIA